ncbi:MAG TPA: putative glycoside hydrolase, partial [Candidatus Peribacteria bacterium]|nr:putative glycoside hydrolase [Candidatus Peribacteria bacterium]
APLASEALASALAWIPSDDAVRTKIRAVVEARDESELARWKAAFARAEGRRDEAKAALLAAVRSGESSAARPLLDGALEDHDFGALGVYSGQQKADHVETFIKAMRASIDRCNPSTKLGISTFAILGWDYARNVETLGQDVVRFAPLVDVISPMAYPATFTSPEYYIPGKNPRSRMYWLVYRTLTGYQKLLGPEDSHKLRPWIQGYGVVKKDMRDQIDAVYDAGLCGYQVWNAGNNYKPVYVALKDEHSRPEACGGTGRLDAVPPGPVEIPGMNW